MPIPVLRVVPWNDKRASEAAGIVGDERCEAARPDPDQRMLPDHDRGGGSVVVPVPHLLEELRDGLGIWAREANRAAAPWARRQAGASLRQAQRESQRPQRPPASPVFETFGACGSPDLAPHRREARTMTPATNAVREPDAHRPIQDRRTTPVSGHPYRGRSPLSSHATTSAAADRGDHAERIGVAHRRRGPAHRAENAGGEKLQIAEDLIARDNYRHEPAGRERSDDPSAEPEPGPRRRPETANRTRGYRYRASSRHSGRRLQPRVEISRPPSWPGAVR